MAFEFEAGDRGVEAGFRRIAAEQIDGALRALAEADKDRAEAIHEVRKSCKRLRGLLRLVRPGFKDYAEENAAVRDAAALLSSLRDAAVLDATLGKVERKLAPEVAADMRSAIAAKAKGVASGDEEMRTLLRCHAALARIRGRAAGWKLKRDGFAALEGGLEAVYGRARDDMARMADEPSAEGFHDWRKQVKYHFHHLDLLSPAAPQMLKSQRKLADRLAESLGEHHDTAVFLQTIEYQAETFGGVRDLHAVKDALQAEQDALAAEAASLGRELLAERPTRLSERLERYWDGWRRAGTSNGAGDGA